MTKKFNITGTCIPEKHFMVNISAKVKKIMELIEAGEYFTINRPRQYGKTTTISNLKKVLKKNPDFLVSSISFEGIGDIVFNDEKTFAPFVLKKIGEGFYDENKKDQFYAAAKNVSDIGALSYQITQLVKEFGKRMVLMIDEVDKSSNNQLFLSFLGMLRNKYLLRNDGEDFTFQSVILAGVHDVKTLKLKLRPDAEQKFNSPWNIATNFEVDMSFNPQEISTMLTDYVKDKKNKMNIPQISQRIFHYTSGYPFLVSRVCKEIDEKILPIRDDKAWLERDVDEAVKTIVDELNTNFESIVANLENNKQLYILTEDIVAGNLVHTYNALNSTIHLGEIYGIFRKFENKVIFHNKIYEEVIANYITSNLALEKSKYMAQEAGRIRFIKSSGKLDIEKVLLKFQEVIKEKHSKSDVLRSNEFLEKDLRLLFLVFLKPIINGIGFCFKEVETSEEKRLDIIIIFKEEKFVVELKLWRGKKYHRQGIVRLKDYMKREGVKKGYMLIMDKTRSKEFVSYTEEGIKMVWI